MTRKILLVDDEIDICKVTKIRLEKLGYDVWVEYSCEGAEELLKHKIPDLILLDLLFPKMCGDEFCKRLKADACLKQIPVILFTATASDVMQICEDCKANDYIMKPFEKDELIGKIRQFIG